MKNINSEKLNGLAEDIGRPILLKISIVFCSFLIAAILTPVAWVCRLSGLICLKALAVELTILIVCLIAFHVIREGIKKQILDFVDRKSENN
jgi:hypothetical protein